MVKDVCRKKAPANDNREPAAKHAHTAEHGQEQGLEQKFQQDRPLLSHQAIFFYTNFTCAFTDRNKHHCHDAETGNKKGNRPDRRQYKRYNSQHGIKSLTLLSNIIGGVRL